MTRPTARSLSTELRDVTAAEHEQAERVPALAALARGTASRPDLAALLGRLLPVYEELERASAHWTGDGQVGRLLQPGLERAARLRADLVQLTGSADPPPSPAAAEYAARVGGVGTCSRPRFVAHHYTRVLADLSGGQLIGAALARALGVRDGAGGSFFAFPGLPLGEVKRDYRRALDELPFDRAQRDELIEEVRRAYALNVALADELAP